MGLGENSTTREKGGADERIQSHTCDRNPERALAI